MPLSLTLEERVELRAKMKARIFSAFGISGHQQEADDTLRRIQGKVDDPRVAALGIDPMMYLLGLLTDTIAERRAAEEVELWCVEKLLEITNEDPKKKKEIRETLARIFQKLSPREEPRLTGMLETHPRLSQMIARREETRANRENKERK